MPTIRKYGRIKRPAILKIRNQLKRKPRPSTKRSLLYEKLKANNDALAKALSKEKQENQNLFSINVALTSEMQEMQVYLNRRDDVIQNVLINSRECLKSLVAATNYVTNNIVECQKIIGKPRSFSRSGHSKGSSIIYAEKRQSITVKSPARGVVQPMVSGHTITKPVINLSRITMPSIQQSPNLSDIDEGLTSEDSPIGSEAPVQRVPVSQQNGFPTGRVERRPERIAVTPPRISDERRDLSQRKNRRSSRYSRKSSPKSSSPSFDSRRNSNVNETIRNPTVALHDVSKLMQKNSLSINIRTFLNSSRLTDTSTREEPSSPEDQLINDTSTVNNGTDSDNSQNDAFDESEDNHTSETCYNLKPKKKKTKSGTLNLNESTSPNRSLSEDFPDDEYTQEDHLETLNYTKPKKKKSKPEDNINVPNEDTTSNQRLSADFSKDAFNDSQEDQSSETFTYTIKSAKTKKANLHSRTNADDPLEGPSWLYDQSQVLQDDDINAYMSMLENTVRPTLNSLNNIVVNGNHDHNGDGNDDDDDDDDDNVCQQIDMNAYAAYKRSKKSDNSPTQADLLRLSENITMTRGRQVPFDEDDFTMCLKSGPPRNVVHFSMNELKLPDLEKPLVTAKPLETEPEITTTINILAPHNTEALRNELAARNFDTSRRNDGDMTMLHVPVIAESMRISELDPVLEDNDQSLGDTSIRRPPVKRKRFNKIALISSSDSEPSQSPEVNTKVKKRNVRKKDPSSAKVVLEKLNRSNTTLIESKVSLDPQSDSESSNASSKMSASRPRRQKAPTNLKEPSLGKKLRR